MITEDDEFARIEREIAMKRGQPYYFEKPSNGPVAWHYPDGKPDQCTTDKAYAEKDPAWTPMYYKHEWVGLTDEELLQAYEWRLTSGVSNFILEEAKQELLGALRKVEAKLKEKNT